MLSVITFLGVFAAPFVGASLVSPDRAMAYVSRSTVVGGLLLWLLLVWSIALAVVGPLLTTTLRAVAG